MPVTRHINILLSIPAIATNPHGVGTGTSESDPSAVQEITARNKELLIPGMTLAEKYVFQGPADGLFDHVPDRSGI